MEWVQTERRRWDVNGRVVGFWKQVGRLSNVVLRNVGHMAPHDNPLVGQVSQQQAGVAGWRRQVRRREDCSVVLLGWLAAGACRWLSGFKAVPGHWMMYARSRVSTCTHWRARGHCPVEGPRCGVGICWGLIGVPTAVNASWCVLLLTTVTDS